MIRWIAATISAAALCLAGFWPSDAAAPDHPAPRNVSTVGTLRVEAYGSGSPALIFIPGLACGSWAWDSAVATYAATHAVYVVTLAGFDGLPPPAGAPLDAADASLLRFITSAKLDRPIVIGHSLGGFLALRFATEHAALLRGVVAVDGTPVFPPLAQSTADERRAAAERIAAQLTPLTREQFAAGERGLMPTLVSDPADADRLAALAAKSDPGATGAYAHDLYAADLRPQLTAATVPILEIAPVPKTPAAFEAPSAATQTVEQRSATYQRFYASLFPGAPNARVVTIADSLHFVQFDQPKALYDAVSAFIASTDK
jgi:pimeloyl-ACP methyl ester carboxylesterase